MEDTPDTCAFRHEFDDDGICVECGGFLPRTPEDWLEIERKRRNIPALRNEQERKEKHGRTFLGCPKCRSETIILGKKRGKNHRNARCADCGYGWKTISREAFGGTRQVEVRG